MTVGRKQDETAAMDARWRAVLARDAQADGCFVYAVRTTGVYCRPSCPSRHARPEHVLFFDTGEAAVQAGFRACKRCQPERPPLAERHAQQIEALCRFIEQSESMPTLDQLAAHAGLSAYHLHRLFKARTGLTPRAYAHAHRARRLREGLAGGEAVTQAIYGAGYSSSGRFYEEAQGVLGMTPTDFKAGGAELPIHFAVGQCSLGAILVAASSKGVCAILMGDDPDALVQDLQKRFHRARLLGGEAGFEQVVARVVGMVESPRLGLDLPLDIRGTAFQQRVWRALQAIPPGQTASYAQIAQSLGSPQSVRAVAGACAANALAVAIPCHRVVRSDGGLSGYRWGVARKRALLAREAET